MLNWAEAWRSTQPPSLIDDLDLLLKVERQAAAEGQGRFRQIRRESIAGEGTHGRAEHGFGILQINDAVVVGLHGGAADGGGEVCLDRG